MSHLPSAPDLWAHVHRPHPHKVQRLLRSVLRNEGYADISVLLAATALSAHPATRTLPRLTAALNRTLHTRLTSARSPSLHIALSALPLAANLPRASLDIVTRFLAATLHVHLTPYAAFKLAAVSARAAIKASTVAQVLRTSIADALPKHPNDAALALCAGFLSAARDVRSVADDVLAKSAFERARAVAAARRKPVPLRADALAIALLPRFILDCLPTADARALATAIGPPVLVDEAAKRFAPVIGRAFAELSARAGHHDIALVELRDTAATHAQGDADRAAPAYIAAALTPVANEPVRATEALSILASLPIRPPRTRTELAAVAARCPRACAKLAARAADAAAAGEENRAAFAMHAAADAMHLARDLTYVNTDVWVRLANAIIKAAPINDKLGSAAVRAGTAFIQSHIVDIVLRASVAERLTRALPAIHDMEAAHRMAAVVDATVRGGLPAEAGGAVVRALGDGVRGAGDKRERALRFGLLMRCVTTCALHTLSAALRETGTVFGDAGLARELFPIARLAVIEADAVRKAELVEWFLGIGSKVRARL